MYRSEELFRSNKDGYGSAQAISVCGMCPSHDGPGFGAAQHVPCKRMGKFKVFCALLLLHILLFSPQRVLQAVCQSCAGVPKSCCTPKNLTSSWLAVAMLAPKPHWPLRAWVAKPCY